MAVLPTESRLPAGFAPEDLGQAAIKYPPYTQAIPELNGLDPSKITFALVSYLSAPLFQNSLNQYVVFITAPDLALKVTSYTWQIFISSEAGYFPRLLQTTTTWEGLFSFRPLEMGEYTIILELKGSGGTVIDSLEMTQVVVPFSDEFAGMVDDLSTTIPGSMDHMPNIMIGEACLTNELANDFFGYIQAAAQEPIDGADNQIPWQLLASIAYREMALSPKESQKGVDSSKPDRATVLSHFRNYLNDPENLDYGVDDWKLGVCQIQPQMLATILMNPKTQTNYIPYLEEDKSQHNGPVISDQRLSAYQALSLEDRIDLSNLLRFPKTNLRMCNLILQKLKNRPNRAPQLDAAGLLADQKTIQIIISEYDQGPTTTSLDMASINTFGRETYSILTSPVMNNLQNLAILSDTWWGVVLDEFGAPLPDVRVDLYQTLLIPSQDLKYWAQMEDYKNPAVALGTLPSGQVCDVLEINRNFVDNKHNLDLVHVSWVNNEAQTLQGWIVTRDGATYYAGLATDSLKSATKTDANGKFHVDYYKAMPIKLRFVKEADAQGNGYFDGEGAWGKVPNYSRIEMQAADHMIKEADIIALLPDWVNYVYSDAWNANYPSNYYLGEDNEKLRKYHLTEVAKLEICCNAFTQALITEAWFLRYPELRWSYSNWEGHTIPNVWDAQKDQFASDPFGPMTETLRSDGKVTMSTLVDISKGQPPPRWSLIQGWAVWAPTTKDHQTAEAGSISGHSFIIVDYHPGTGSVLTIEANHAEKKYKLNGVGSRGIGNVSTQLRNGVITPNVDRVWIEKGTPTWQQTTAAYNKLADPDHNPYGLINPLGIVRLKVYDLQWSGAEML